MKKRRSVFGEKHSQKTRENRSTDVHVKTSVKTSSHVSGNQLQERIDELTHDLQRLQAEFANYKRREGEAKTELISLARQEVVRELLPLLDNIDRAISHLPEHLADDPWAKGVAQISRQAEETLGEMGVEKIATVGEVFDHNLHEAVGMEDGDGEHEVVVEELQPGYKAGDRVIRHAMVKVGRK